MISVIVPVFNEPNLTRNLKRLHEELPKDHEIIVVDDGGEVFKFPDFPKTKFVRKPFNEGKGAAIQAGLQYAEGEYVIILDGDLQIKSDIKSFLNIMELYDADAVIGNKRHPYSIVHYSPFRWVVSNTYNLLCRVLFGIQLRDTQTGFKLFKREAIEKVMRKVMVKRFAFDLELILALRESGFRVADAPVVVNKTESGCASAGNILQTLIDTLAVFYRRSIGWYR